MIKYEVRNSFNECLCSLSSKGQSEIVFNSQLKIDQSSTLWRVVTTETNITPGFNDSKHIPDDDES